MITDKRIYGAVTLRGCPVEGRAVIVGRESRGKFWVIMLSDGWHCIVDRQYIVKQ